MQYWLMKSEPETYSWNDLCREGVGTWDGVRNYQARNNLRAMKKGDRCFFYHSITGKEIVGICQVVEEHSPDETAEDGDWSVVKVSALEVFETPVTLAQIKADPQLSEMALIRQGRLSVCPVTPEEFTHLRKLGKSRAVG
jgi:predicted RNA-binding protein with PUA-like domain